MGRQKLEKRKPLHAKLYSNPPWKERTLHISGFSEGGILISALRPWYLTTGSGGPTYRLSQSWLLHTTGVQLQEIDRSKRPGSIHWTGIGGFMGNTPFSGLWGQCPPPPPNQENNSQLYGKLVASPWIIHRHIRETGKELWKQKWRTCTTAEAPSRGWPVKDRGEEASLLPYTPTGVTGSN